MPCQSTEYQTAPVTATSQPTCAAISPACAGNQFESKASTHTSDRECTARTCCGFGKYRLDSTPTSDGRCAQCTVGKFRAAEDQTSPTCDVTDPSCTSCPAGTFGHATGAQFSESAHCTPCEAGSVNAGTGAAQCTSCVDGSTFNTGTTAATKLACAVCAASCPAHQYISEACTKTADAVCANRPVVGVGGKAIAFTEGTAINVAPAATVTFASTLAKATVVLTGGASFDVPVFDTTGYTGPISASVAGHTITLSGEGDSSDYASALQRVQFRCTDTTYRPTRTVTMNFQVYDSATTVTSDVASVSVDVMPSNGAPVVMDATATAQYIQNGQPAAFATAMRFADAGSTGLASLTVQIVNVHQGDTLDFDVSTPSITATYTPGTGTLVLSATAGMAPTFADFQAIVRTLRFSNTVKRPHTENRQVAFIANDGTKSSPSDPLTTITVCAAQGYFAEQTSLRATLCPQGKYQPSSCGTQCAGCAQGKHAAAPSTYTAPAVLEAASCTGCAAGRYQTAVGQVSCVACGTGKYGSAGIAKNTAAHCVDCVAGTYQLATAQTSCTNCEAGKYADAPGSAMCQAFACCSAGHARAETSPSSGGTCAVCMPGTFKAEGAQCLAACAQCAAGKFGDNQQSTSVATYCVDCATGRYESQTGTHSDAASSCTACAAGTHQSLEGKSSCDGCADGTYQTATGQASCDACAAGKYGRANFDCAEGMEINALGECTPVRDVTCAFTVDNTIHNVYVGGIDVSGKVSGNLDNWTTRKTYTFQIGRASCRERV